VFGELHIGGHLTAVAAGQLDAVGTLAVTFPVPSMPILRAITLRWQGITSNAATLIWAEPATECHG
jgi:hypothetical protein